MKFNPEHIASQIIKHRILILLIIGILTVLGIFQIRKLEVFNDIEIWLDRSEDEYKNYMEFKADFGNDETILLLHRNDSLFSPAQLDLNRELNRELEDIEGVQEVKSLTNVKLLTQLITGQYFVHSIPEETKQAEKWRARIQATRSFAGQVLSRDGLSTSYTIILKSESNKDEVIRQTAEVADRHLAGQGEHILFGVVLLKQELNRLSSKESKRFLSLCVLLIIAVNLLVFRRLISALLPILIAILTIVWTFALIAIFNIGINVVISILPLILLVISMAFSIHFLTGLSGITKEFPEKNSAISKNFASIIKLCFLSALTTAIALLVFAFSKINPLAEFGIFSALGIIIAFFLTFTLLPVLYSFVELRADTIIFHEKKIKWSATLKAFIQRRKKEIFIACGIILAISIFGLIHLRSQTDQIAYFKKDHPLRQDYNKAGEWFGGIVPMELIVEFDSSIYSHNKEILSSLLTFEKSLDTVELLKSRQSLLLFLEDAGMIDPLDNYVRNIDLSAPMLSDIIGNFVSDDGKRTRIAVKIPWMDDSKAYQLMGLIEELASEAFSSLASDFYISGSVPIFAHLSRRLVKSQVNSLVLAFFIILLIFLILYRKPGFALLCMLPNLLPVISTLGLMGLLHIPLDVVTILVASISLGIAIDDTIHFVGTYRNFQKTNLPEDAVNLSFIKVGKPLLITTLLLVCGFSIMVFSSYKPIIYLGIFISLNLSLALLYDLLLLPAILLSSQKMNKGK